MKGKLIKLNLGPGYRLNDEDGNLFASTLAFSKTKLSKQNCDEIFGIVNAESEFYKIQPNTLSPETEHKVKVGFTMGFNKAMELNKDKLFTLGDMMNMYIVGGKYKSQQPITFLEKGDEIIQTLQQPTEIDVEVVYQRACCADNFTCGNEDNCMICTRTFPKLDSAGCLILKKI